MRKLLLLTSVLTVMISTSVFAAAKYNDDYYNIKTKASGGELMLEARSVFGAMGYSVNWDANTKTTVFTDGKNTYSIVNATGDVSFNGNVLAPAVKPFVEQGVTYIPVSILANSGIRAEWDFDKAYPLLYSQDYTPSAEENKSEKDEDKKDSESIKEGWNAQHTEYYHEGQKITGPCYIDGNMYTFTDGTLITGIFTEGTAVKGYDEFGNPYDGFTEKDGKKYYFENGTALNKPSVINGKMYNFAADGTLTTGWTEKDGKKMYFNEFGYGAEGIADVDGGKYYFINGVMQTGAVTYNDKYYYFNEDGTMVVNKQIDDIYYGADGIGTKYSQAYLALMNRADNILSQTGKSAYGIYNYVAAHVKYKYMAQQDWTTMATSAFSTGRGACYHFAACVDILLKRAGYETRVVRGTGHYTSLHYWNQVKINGTWTNLDACNKYYNVSDAYLRGRNYTFGKYEYPVYY